MGNARIPRLAAIALAVVLVASVTNWVLTFTSGRIPSEPVRDLPANETEVGARGVDTAPIAQLFGASGDAPTNIRALGVMAEGSTGRGIALIGIEGKPARAVRAGESIAPGIILAEVRRDGVVVNRSGALQQIRLATKPPAQGLLPAR
jgi:general secretion pathway protein C